MFEDIEGLSEAQTEQLKSKFDAELQGLKEKNDALIGEKRTESEKRKAAEEERQNAAIEAAKKSGELETLEKTLSEKYGADLAARQHEIDSLNNSILSSKKAEAVTSIASAFISPAAATLMLNAMTEVSRSEDGIVKSFKGVDGEVVTTDPAKFIEYLKSNPDTKPLMRGVDSSGGGALGGGGGGGAEEKSAADILYPTN